MLLIAFKRGRFRRNLINPVSRDVNNAKSQRQCCLLATHRGSKHHSEWHWKMIIKVSPSKESLFRKSLIMEVENALA